MSYLKYVVFGGLAAGVNVGFYALFTRIIGMPITVSTAIAWLLANLFSFACNRILVFRKERNDTVLQILASLAIFLATRLISGLGDVGAMYVFAQKLGLYDFAVKIISAAFWGTLNYFIGKFFIFK